MKRSLQTHRLHHRRWLFLGGCTLGLALGVLNSQAATLYIDEAQGNNFYDGLSNVVANGHGPLLNIANAISIASNGDVLSVGFGFYQETNWDFGAKALTMNLVSTAVIYDTDPNITDSDGDGIPDAWEVMNGLNPFDAADAGAISSNAFAHGLTNLQVYQNPSVLISDGYSTVGDGIPDWWKVLYGFSLTDPTVAFSDPDKDGHTNLQEYRNDTYPTNSLSYPTNAPDFVCWWPFDEGSGTITAALGTSLPGILTGSPLPIWTTGIFSNALAFNGASNEVDVADDPLLSPTNALSVMAWVKTATNLTSEVVAKWSTNTVAGSYLLSLTNGQVSLELMLDGAYNMLVGGDSLSDTNWHHIAGTYDGAEMRVFLDGASVGTQAASGTVDVVTDPLRLGLLAGELDDVRLYQTALTTNGVAAVYNGDSDGDGMPDLWEIQHGLNPFNPDDASQVSINPFAHGLTNLQTYQNPSVLISDGYSTVGDGIPDWWKVTYGFSLTDTNVATADPDGDGINNLQEYQYFTNPTASNVLDVVVNGGSRWATNQTISVDATSYPYPFLTASILVDGTNIVALLANNGSLSTYTLPSNTNRIYSIFFQYADANTNALGPVISKIVALDTYPPWVEITNPTNAVGDQAFVHLQATVYDPSPTNDITPDRSRPIRVWINGTPYWNKNGTQIDIPRFAVQPNTNNDITVTVQDEAGNTSEAFTSIYIDPSTDTNMPTLSNFDLQPDTNGVITFPDVPQIWVEGEMTNLNSIVTATVNGGSPFTLNVWSNQFGYLLPIDFGTNTVVVMGSNAAGLINSNVFTVVRTDRFRLSITSPAFGAYADGAAQTVSGYVSAVKDAGLPTQTNVVSVTVNGIGTNLGTIDGSGNRSFTTTNTVPVPTDGGPSVYNVTVVWADGTSNDPPSLQNGTYIISGESDDDATTTIAPCGGWVFNYYIWGDDYTLSIDETMEQIYDNAWDCYGDSSLFSTNIVTHPNPPGLSLKAGIYTDNEDYPLDPVYSEVDHNWCGQETVMIGRDVGSTEAIFTFSGINYPVINSTTLDMSLVTYRGQSPFAWDNTSGSASFLFPISTGPLTVDASDLQCPGYDVTTVSTDDPGVIIDSAHWSSFAGFTIQPVNVTVTPSNFVACIGQTNTFTASSDLSGLSYSWSAQGGTVASTSGSQNETAEIFFTQPAPNTSVQATASGGALSGVSTGSVGPTTILHTTVATTPSDTNRTTIGIGEQVNCSLDFGCSATWWVVGGGTLSSLSGNSTVFTAPKPSALGAITCTVYAQVGSTAPLSVAFNVIPPSGQAFGVWFDEPYGRQGPPNNLIWSATYFVVNVLPTTVSFQNVLFRENKPGDAWTWPNGMADSVGVGTPTWTVGDKNVGFDNVSTVARPVAYLSNGTNYVDKSIPIRVPEEYQNDDDAWTLWYSNEIHTWDYTGSTLQSKVLINGVSGGEMGPWQ